MSTEANDSRPQASPQDHLECVLRSLAPGGCEISLVDLVLLACEASADAGEIDDLVEGVIRSGAAHVLPAACDPMLQRLETSAAAA